MVLGQITWGTNRFDGLLLGDCSFEGGIVSSGAFAQRGFSLVRMVRLLLCGGFLKEFLTGYSKTGQT